MSGNNRARFRGYSAKSAENSEEPSHPCLIRRQAVTFATKIVAATGFVTKVTAHPGVRWEEFSFRTGFPGTQIPGMASACIGSPSSD